MMIRNEVADARARATEGTEAILAARRPHIAAAWVRVAKIVEVLSEPAHVK